MKKYEIWIEGRCMVQGDSLCGKPKKIGEVTATSFRIACCIYEHQSAIDCLKLQMERGDAYIEDVHFGTWDYNPKTNSNNWLGEYFESEDAAIESRKRR